MNYLDIALEYHSAGFNVVPVSQTKQPMVTSWKQWQDRQQTEEEVRQIFSKDSWGIALICGWNNVEVIDVDVKNDPDGTVLEDLKAELKREPYKFIEDYAFQSTPTGGAHLIYRNHTKPPGNNSNLARKQGKAIIETRGSGGYALVAPSPGYKMWWKERLVNSSLTEDERDGLMTLCKTFNEDHEGFKEAQPKRTSDELRPGDIYNRDTTRHEIIEMLEYHGWTVVRERGKQVHFCRPGKTEGVSGNWHDDHHKFYCFTSSASPLQADTSYSPFALLVALEYGGDWTRAAKDIAPSEPATIEQKLEATKDIPEEQKWPGAFLYNPYEDDGSEPDWRVAYTTLNEQYNWLAVDSVLSLGGEEKSRKSKLLHTIALAGVMMKPLMGFKWLKQPRKIIIFDTEQQDTWVKQAGRYFTYAFGSKEWMDVINLYSIMPLSQRDKIDFIEEKMYLARRDGEVDMMIVDGIVDLMSNFNDVEKSYEIFNRLVQIQGKQTILANVIHLNPGTLNKKERGHLGTISMQKSDSIVRLTYNDESGISKAKCYRARYKRWPEFEFTHDKQGKHLVEIDGIDHRQYSNL